MCVSVVIISVTYIHLILDEQLNLSSVYIAVNPLTTDDAFGVVRFWPHACYQLAQSVLKIGSALAERVGQGVGGWVHRSA